MNTEINLAVLTSKYIGESRGGARNTEINLAVLTSKYIGESRGGARNSRMLFVSNE